MYVNTLRSRHYIVWEQSYTYFRCSHRADYNLVQLKQLIYFDHVTESGIVEDDH